jgi:hypothetical protein
MILLFSLENKINGRSEGPILFGTNVALTFTHLRKNDAAIATVSP